jgi:hypothetical protein
MAGNRNSPKVHRSKVHPDLEYTVESFCVGYKKSVHKNGRGPLVCHGLNFVRVTVKKGELPSNMEKLRLPPTLGVRVVMAVQEEEVEKPVANRKKFEPPELTWESTKVFMRQQYWAFGDVLRNLKLVERSKDVCRNSLAVVKSLWDGYVSGGKWP